MGKRTRLISEFNRQVLPHLNAAYNLVRWVRDPDAAQDIVQEAMARALKYHVGLRGDVRPWLLQIVRNLAYASLLAQQADLSPAVDSAADAVDPADDPLAAL